ncbi:MAG: hypothetical protein SFY32_02040 [Bacteroidota bacterium]|nr:hypothetical protein [Bacteroidota bacterium]
MTSISKQILGLAIVFISLTNISAQNYKKLKVPTVEVSGEVNDANGTLLGSIDKEGIIKDASGNKIAYIDAFGSTIDAKTEEKICKTDQEGNMLAVVNKKVVSWKTYHPEPGMELCLIKDFKGNLVAATHKRYKQFGSSVIYYFLGILKTAAPTTNAGAVNAGISNEKAAQESVEKTETKTVSKTTNDGTTTKSTTKTTTKSSKKKTTTKTVTKKSAKKKAPAKKAAAKGKKKKKS